MTRALASPSVATMKRDPYPIAHVTALAATLETP
jgi:hypothetical protein